MEEDRGDRLTNDPGQKMKTITVTRGQCINGVWTDERTEIVVSEADWEKVKAQALAGAPSSEIDPRFV